MSFLYLIKLIVIISFNTQSTFKCPSYAKTILLYSSFVQMCIRLSFSLGVAVNHMSFKSFLSVFETRSHPTYLFLLFPLAYSKGCL